MDHKDYADLVERLQEPQVTYHPVHGIIRFDAPDDICIEAAERIKELEAALRYIIDEWADEYEAGGLENFCRAALGEKKDD